MLYINFLYAPNGGGYQNSISFLTTLIKQDHKFYNTTILLYKNSLLEHLCIDNEINYLAVNNGILARIRFELSAHKFIKKGDIVFSLFGPPLPFTTSTSLNIGGVAVSNLFYNDLDFWFYLNPVKKLIKKIKDLYRKKRYKELDYWIFETDILKNKAVNDFLFPPDRCCVIKMAPSKIVSLENIKKEFNETDRLPDDEVVKFLFLCSAHPNKRLHILPELAQIMSKNGFNNFCFILTADENAYLSKINLDIKTRNVAKYFYNIGSISPDNVSTVISKCDYVCTFSLLESFSNNFVEAWAMNKPLVVTSADWAKESCGQAAFYADLENISNLANQLISLTSDLNIDNILIKAGSAILKEYPTAEEKAHQYLRTIERAIEIGKITTNQTNKIRF